MVSRPGQPGDAMQPRSVLFSRQPRAALIDELREIRELRQREAHDLMIGDLHRLIMSSLSVAAIVAGGVYGLLLIVDLMAT